MIYIIAYKIKWKFSKSDISKGESNKCFEVLQGFGNRMKMKLFKRLLMKIISLSLTIIVLSKFNVEAISKNKDTNLRKIIKVGVLVYSKDVFSFNIVKSLEDIQKENKDKVEFTIFNMQDNLIIGSEYLDKMLNNDYDLILANITGKIQPEQIEQAIYKAKQKNISLIFFNTNPIMLNTIKGYSKSLIINNDSKQAGILQGTMITDFWNTNWDVIDRNGDGILQYIIVKGYPNSFSAEDRSKYSISTINKSGIKTQELASITANWSKETSKNAMESLFLGYAGKIEAIIANNDAMAIGAIEAIQRYGYNIGNKEKIIPVFGINAIPEAQELIKKGFMTGSVFQDPRKFADALYTVGMNLVFDKAPLEGTQYSFDETGVIIQIPFEKTIIQN